MTVTEAPVVVQFTDPGVVELVSAPVAPLPPGHIRIRTWYSGISAGTELTAYRGSNPYLTKSWDAERHVFRAGTPTFEYPIRGWGYSEVGEVVEVAADVEVAHPGQVVAGIWGHRSEGVIPVTATHWRVLPEGMTAIHGVFARAGAIAHNSVLAAELRYSETVAIFGQGVIGLLATQVARLSGARIAAIDTRAARLEVARELGAAHTIEAQTPGGAGVAVRDWAGDSGCDTAIELSGSYQALHEAIRCVAVDGVVVASGFYQGDAVGLRLGEEFHHNRVRLLSSQIGGTPLPMGPRWNQRRLVATFVDAVANDEVSVGPLISDVIDVTDVAAAYELLEQGAPETLQVVLRFAAAPA